QFGDPITQYTLFNLGTGGGRFMFNGNPLATNQNIVLTPGQFAQVTYQAGAGTDTLWAQVSDGNVTSAWSPAITVQGLTNPIVAAGSTLELGSAFAGTVSFAGTTGTLKIDHSNTFGGSVAGQLVIGDVIDLADVTAGAGASVAYTGNNS